MIPTDAARNALAAHIATRLSLTLNTHVLTDWPPATMALPRAGTSDTAAVAVSVIDAGAPEHTPEMGATLLSSTPVGDASATHRHRLGAWTLPLAIEVWAASRRARADRTAQVWAALNEPPSADVRASAGLTLTLADYFSAPCTFDCEGWDTHPSPEGVDREEWRVTFQVTARVDDISETTATRLTATTADVAASPTLTP